MSFLKKIAFILFALLLLRFVDKQGDLLKNECEVSNDCILYFSEIQR
jgi:hypothetical protein